MQIVFLVKQYMSGGPKFNYLLSNIEMLKLIPKKKTVKMLNSTNINHYDFIKILKKKDYIKKEFLVFYK